MSTLQSSKHFGRMCRTCMYKEEPAIATKKRTGRRSERQEQRQLMTIYDYPKENKQMQIVDILTYSTPQLLIQATDELPKFVCALCLGKLLAMHQYQQLCIRSEHHMRNLLEYNAVEAKFAQADDTPTTTAVDKLTNDPLQAGGCEAIAGCNVSVSMEDVQSFLKLEMDEQDVSILSMPARLYEHVEDTVKAEARSIVKNSVDINVSDSMADSEEDNDSDWAAQQQKMSKQRKMKKPERKKLKTSLKLEVVKKELKTEEMASGCETSENAVNASPAIAEGVKKSHTDGITKVTSHKCDKCPRKYIKLEALKKHQLLHNKGLVKEYACEMCDKKFMKRYSLNRHLRSHDLSNEGEDSKKREIPRPYICEYCNKAFQQSCTLKDHIRVHTGEQPFLCSECGKAFNSASNMKQHLLRHTGLKRYECPECPKKFPCLSDLASHKAVHKKIKPHVCDICGAAFGKPFQLKKHKMYHNGEKPHKCEYCEMRFVCADHMRRHQRTHTGEKPYKCKYCERAFAQSNDLIKHLRSHMGDNVYKCELCPKAFRLASELREHFAEHKNDDEPTRQQNLKALLEEEARLRINLLGGRSNTQEQSNNGFCV